MAGDAGTGAVCRGARNAGWSGAGGGCRRGSGIGSGGQSRFYAAARARAGGGTFGAVASVEVPASGAIQISLSGEAWIDVIQDGKAIKSAGYSGVKTCPGIRKSVRFKLAAGPAIVQFSGAKKAELKVAVLTPE